MQVRLQLVVSHKFNEGNGVLEILFLSRRVDLVSHSTQIVKCISKTTVQVILLHLLCQLVACHYVFEFNLKLQHVFILEIVFHALLIPDEIFKYLNDESLKGLILFHLFTYQINLRIKNTRCSWFANISFILQQTQNGYSE